MFGITASESLIEVVRVELAERHRESEQRALGRLAARLLKQDARRRAAARRVKAQAGLDA